MREVLRDLPDLGIPRAPSRRRPRQILRGEPGAAVVFGWGALGRGIGLTLRFWITWVLRV